MRVDARPSQEGLRRDLAQVLADAGIVGTALREVPGQGRRERFACTRSGIFVQVHADGEDPQQIRRRLTQATALASQGARILAPLDTTPLALPDGREVTTWPLAVAGTTTTEDFAAILRSLHDCSESTLPAWDLLPVLSDRVGAAKASDVEASPELVTVNRWIEDLIARQPRIDGPVPIHTDAHAENVMRLGDGFVLIDLDFLALGPREFDIATRIVDNPREQEPAADIDRLVPFYGADLVDPGTLAWCCDVREANVISWLLTDGRHWPPADVELGRWLSALPPSSGWWRHAGASA